MKLRMTAFNQVSTGITAAVVGAILLFKSTIAPWAPWAGGGLLLLGVALIALGVRHYRTSPRDTSEPKKQATLGQCVGLAVAVLLAGGFSALRYFGQDHASPVGSSIDLIVTVLCLIGLVVAIVGAAQAVHRTRT